MARSKISRSWLISALVLMLFAFSLLTAFGDRGLRHLWRLSEERNRASENIFRLHKENEALRSTIHQLRYDDFYLEKKVREDHRFAGPGEIVYQFASEDSRGIMDDPVTRQGSQSLQSWK